MKKIKINKIRCKKCGDVIESKSVHDYKWCSCLSVAVDGGKDYLKRSGNRGDFEELSEYEVITLDDVIGKWSVDIMYESGTQEDIIVLFLPNGTGYIAFYHYILCELETFHWRLEHDGKMSIIGDKYNESDDIFEKSPLNLNSISVDVKKELTPSGKCMDVILFSSPLWLSENKFGLITKEITDEALPQLD